MLVLGNTDNAGTIFLISGRKDKENINLKEDKSFILISMNTNIDDNLGITIGDSKSSVASIALKTDELRIFAKKGAKIVVDSGDLYLNASNVFIADKSNNTEQAILGNTLKQVFSDMLDAIGNFQLITPAGPAPLMPLKIAIQAQISAGLENMLSKTIKLKKN